MIVKPVFYTYIMKTNIYYRDGFFYTPYMVLKQYVLKRQLYIKIIALDLVSRQHGQTQPDTMTEHCSVPIRRSQIFNFYKRLYIKSARVGRKVSIKI